MDEHISFLENLCRLCGKGLSSKADLAHKNSFKRELLVQFEINVDNDSEEVHPLSICPDASGYSTESEELEEIHIKLKPRKGHIRRQSIAKRSVLVLRNQEGALQKR